MGGKKEKEKMAKSSPSNKQILSKGLRRAESPSFPSNAQQEVSLTSDSREEAKNQQLMGT